MNKAEKALLKFFSNILTDVKRHYKTYRCLLNVFNPAFAQVYGALDRKIIVSGREIPLRVFRFGRGKKPKVMIFFHGGGWVTGNIDTYTKICAIMARRTKHTLVSVDYRLAPENPFPAGLEDCFNVTKELFEKTHLLGCKAEDITLVGDSAGANLAAVVSLMARDKAAFWPKKQILIYPATYFDHGEDSPFPSVHQYGKNHLLTAEKIQNYMDLYVPNEEDRLSPYVAPLLAKDLSNQPETLIITAEYDPLRDEGEAYGERLREFGNKAQVYRMNGALHNFLALRKKSGASAKCYNVMNEFLWGEKTDKADMP
ncbi:MAG: alpha/beta hydrolase [Clostridiales bacterium]|nr:alpha/beta hydrolase [Clostridiales bacterium]